MADTDAMHELAEFFFAQAEQELTAMEAALKAGTAEEVRRLAHRLLGASAGCGMVGMVKPLAELEQQAKAGDLAIGEVVFPRLIALLEQSRAEIAQWKADIHSEEI